MSEIRNPNNGLSLDSRGTVCIDTYRVLDCCRDRDCFENTRIYLTQSGEEALAGATGVRTRSARVLWAYVGVDEVPFNRGFYQITVRYYVMVECEVCQGIGRSANVLGIAILEKNVVLYGGEGRVVSYSSSKENRYCNIGDFDTVGDNEPVAIVETVDPVVLGTKIDCECNCCTHIDPGEVPAPIMQNFDGELVMTSNGPHLYVSFGLFSVVRIQRPAQFLVGATDYSVPEKECTPAGRDESPCSLFRTIAFPVGEFRGTGTPGEQPTRRGGICGCLNNNQDR